MESQTSLMSWHWKRKPTWRKNLITYNSYPWIMFSFNWLVIIWTEEGGIRLKLDVQGQGGGRILDVAWGGGLANWTIFMDVMYVSSLNNKPLASWVAHITRDSLTCYSCSYYSSVLEVKLFIFQLRVSNSKWNFLFFNFERGTKSETFCFSTLS